MLVASLAIGVYAARTGGKQKTTREFLIGNRELTLLPVFVSFVMSYTSGVYYSFFLLLKFCLPFMSPNTGGGVTDTWVNMRIHLSKCHHINWEILIGHENRHLFVSHIKTFLQILESMEAIFREGPLMFVHVKNSTLWSVLCDMAVFFCLSPLPLVCIADPPFLSN